MFDPIIEEPVFAGAQHVVVHSIEAGSQVNVLTGQRRTTGSFLHWQSIGVSTATSGRLTVELDRPLEPSDVLRVVAEKDEQTASSVSGVRVQPLPLPLPAPICYSTLYAGSCCMNTWGMVPGSKVQVVSGAEPLGEALAIRGGAWVHLRRPLKDTDLISLFATIGGHESPHTIGIKPVIPHGSLAYAEKPPTPSIRTPILACQDRVGVDGILPGGRLQVEVDDNLVFDECSPVLGVAAVLGNQLQENQMVAARQVFEALNLKSDLSDAVRVGPAQNLPKPRILEPLYSGERKIFIDYLLASVKVELAVIAVDGTQTIHTGDNVESNDFGLRLEAGQHIKVRQGLCGRWSPWSDEVVVRNSPEVVPPPKVKDPLYEGANQVQIENYVEGALVTVFATFALPRANREEEHFAKIQIGTMKGSLVKVWPQILEGWEITATQSVGEAVSQPSQPPVVVKKVSDLPPPKWHPDQVWETKYIGAPSVLRVDACASHATFDNLIPGAQVNVFWNTLMVGSDEAADTTWGIPLQVKLQPGAEISANQSLATKKSSNSGKATATALVMFDAKNISGRSGPFASTLSYQQPQNYAVISAMFGDKLHIPVVTKCPVFAELKIPIVISVRGQEKKQDVTIPKGKTVGEFILEVTEVGDIWIQGLPPGGYQWVPDFGWGMYLQALGTLKLTPMQMTITVGSSSNLSITLKPPPFDRKLPLTIPPYTITKVPADSPISFPLEVIVPAGTDTVTVAVEGVREGVEAITTAFGMISPWLDADTLSFQSPHCTVTVIPKGETPPPPPQIAELVAVQTWIEPSYPQVNQNFLVYCNICNTGSTKSGNFTIRFELDGGLDATDVNADLLPGQCTTAWWSHAGVGAGPHYIYVYADWKSVVNEVTKGNNIGYVGFSVG